MTDSADSQTPRSFVAPCRALDWPAPLRWLRLGWRDLTRAPQQSLIYGALMVVVSYLITAGTWYFGNLGLYLGLVSGFVFLGPLLALGLYAISARLERGARVSLGATLRDAFYVVGDALIFAVILLVIFLIWARAAAMVYVFFPVDGQTSTLDWIVFLAIGSAVGAVFCALIFVAGAFSLPMVLDRRTDTVTAVVTSVNAVLRNKPAMAVWAACIGACVLAGMLTAYLGLAVLLPLLGHATWHAYREAIDASAWPGNAPGASGEDAATR